MPETSSTRLGDERLLKLAAALDPFPSRHFNMNHIFVRPDDRLAIGNAVLGGSECASCGTACCALALCLFVFPDDWNWSERYEAPCLRQSMSPFSSAEQFFGIGEDDSTALFCEHDDNKTPTALAAKIRKFVEGRQKHD